MIVKCEWDMPESRQDARIEFLGRTALYDCVLRCYHQRARRRGHISR